MKITEFTPKDSINANHRKQNGYSGSYVGLDIANKKELFECRIYWTKERCYACLWVLGSQYASGSAYAGGYGYCKESTAIHSALNNAGIKLDQNIAGTGRHKEAFEALASYLTDNDTMIIHTHP